MPDQSNFRPLLRVLNTSVDGNRTLAHGLSMVKGVGRRIADACIRVVGFDPRTRIGELSDKEIERLEEVLKNPVAHGIPKWMVNRQHDLRTGEYRHITANELEVVLKSDLDRMKRTQSRKGVRHSLGLKVRGQRTRTTGRKGLTVGYFRKKKKQQQKKG
ncbi:MAG: 30S ribosomal protein S13 [Promethearchaeota archaeon]